MRSPDNLKAKPKVRRNTVKLPWLKTHDLILMPRETQRIIIAITKNEEGYHATYARLGIKITTKVKNELLGLIIEAIADKWRNKAKQPKEYQDHLNQMFRQIPPDVQTIMTNES